MKWLKFNDQYCDEFLEFADNTVDASAVERILEIICEGGNDTDVIVTNRTSLDREGGNHEMTGYVIQGDREFGFHVQNGNWAGTEVLGWGEDQSFRLTDRSDYY